MRAIVITRPGEAEVLQLQEVEDPSPGEDELLVQTRAAALNRADLMQRKGHYPAPEGYRDDIPGLEFSGVVEKTGKSVRDFQVGDRVMGLLAGEGYAEKVRVPAATSLAIPDELSFEEAAAIPEVFLTAYDALFRQLEIRFGERLLIHAAGSGVGVAGVQMASLAGLTVFGTAGSKGKLDKAKELGLAYAINYKDSDFASVIQKETNAEGVHAIMDLVGASYWEKNLECLGTLGRMIIVGLLGGREVKANLGTLLSKRLRIFGTALRTRALFEKAELVDEFQKLVIPLFASKTLRAVVDRVFDWKDVIDAHRYMEANQNFGKIVLKVQ